MKNRDFWKVRHSLLALAALAFLAPASALAQGGINLSWNDCGTFGQELKTFACDTNAGTDLLYVSAAPSVDMPQLEGTEIDVRFFFTGPTISPWWHLEAGGCRAGQVTGVFDFTSGPSSCVDPWGFGAQGGVVWNSGFGGANLAQLRGVAAIPGTTVLAAGSEAYLMAFAFRHLKTVGTGSCGGCNDAACITLFSAKLVQPIGVGDYVITNPLDRQTASWKCPGTMTGGGPFEGPYVCSASCPVPARTNTWGTVKSLYR